jgi:Fe-S cluster biogenesis protein NfuA
MTTMTEQEKEHLRLRIEEALDAMRPHLQVDGGNVELVDITDDMCVHIRWLGMCQHCTISPMTIRGLSESIRGRVPEIQDVVAVNGL